MVYAMGPLSEEEVQRWRTAIVDAEQSFAPPSLETFRPGEATTATEGVTKLIASWETVPVGHRNQILDDATKSKFSAISEKVAAWSHVIAFLYGKVIDGLCAHLQTEPSIDQSSQSRR